MKKLYKVGIYCRLSVEDAANSAKAKNYIPGDESVSIENQYEILSKFVMLNGWVEAKTYRDDGYSGGNFQRPGFREMLDDARSGLINLILVKDLSRLGRDFVEVGRYTDVVFPSLGCRFVSVLDCLDSEGDNTDMLHFRSLMNDYHLKDLSNKIKSVLHAKKKSGQFLGAFAPYGYRKCEDDKHKLLIDEEAAAIVRRIFEMRRSGTSYGGIAATLNQEGILSPRWHWETHYGKGSCKYAKTWAYATIRNILKDKVYLGTLTQNRTGSRSYKDGTQIQKPETEWITHEDAHEAIISSELWEAVQEINRAAKLRSVDNSAPTPALFTSKLICADCGHPLVANRETKHRKNGTVKKYTYCYVLLISPQHPESSPQQMDKVSGTITGATFSLLIEKSEQERIQKSEQLDTLLAEADKDRQDMEDIQKWTSIIKKYLDLQGLDRETVDELIDHIEIGERTVIDGQKQQDIKIFYRFVGEV